MLSYNWEILKFTLRVEWNTFPLRLVVTARGTIPISPRIATYKTTSATSINTGPEIIEAYFSSDDRSPITNFLNCASALREIGSQELNNYFLCCQAFSPKVGSCAAIKY